MKLFAKLILALLAIFAGGLVWRSSTHWSRNNSPSPSQGSVVALKQSEPVYDKLDQREFKRRMGESFPSVYLTVISIIQGVALGILGLNSFGYVSTLKSQTIENWLSILPYTFLSFLAIVVVSFEYNWFVGVYRWSPKFWDTLIPFSLGLAQIGPLYFLNQPRIWWILNGVFVLVGTIAFVNTLSNCKEDMFETINVYKMTKSGVHRDIVLTAALVIILFLTGILYNCSTKLYYWHKHEIVAFIIYFLLMVLLISKDQNFIRKLHHKFNLKF